MVNIVRRDPIEDFFRGFLVRPVEASGLAGEGQPMRVDIRETAEGYAVQAELPGVSKENIHVDIDGAVVSISAERVVEKEEKDGERVLHKERYFGKISRSFQLAQDVDEAASTAKFEDGVLKLTLPTKKAEKAKRLTIS